MRTTQFQGKNWDLFESEVRVYSLKSNSWRRIQDFPYYLWHSFQHGVFVGGALHWVVSRNYESDSVNFLVAAFDLTNEEYRLVPQPEFSDEGFYICVGELDGCLCIFCNYDQVRFDVWVMKDYGVKESWSKLFSIAKPQGIRLFDSVTPVAYSKSGGEVLLVQDNDNLIWFDLEHKTVKNINIHGLPKLFVTNMCVESLVPLKGEESQGVKVVGTDYTGDMLLTQSTFARQYNLIPCCHENRTASTRTIRIGGLPPWIDFHGAKNINFRIANHAESLVPVAHIDVQFGDFVVHDA
ncbi:hypothetical protein TEA_014491 [Camellia sinensis var. sinensis]|uniref:F-box associated beta-propeller type 1 domain-containing protein n=1 Tax=Camellia sinensis var. sinensis TaxID=542762 RepID=A0A4S4DL37_CAMSN|nr:hypothetical protein TEA_014491 [Camellia sinensis var. sinensis]